MVTAQRKLPGGSHDRTPWRQGGKWDWLREKLGCDADSAKDSGNSRELWARTALKSWPDL